MVLHAPELLLQNADVHKQTVWEHKSNERAGARLSLFVCVCVSAIMHHVNILWSRRR